jgi:hypothetical protein
MTMPFPRGPFLRHGPGGTRHRFSPQEVEGLMAGIYRRGDRLRLWFLVAHFLLGLLLAYCHQTWAATLLVGGATLGGFAFLA